LQTEILISSPAFVRSMHVLLVEPEYYSRYPPLGLLKLSTYHKRRGDTTELVRGLKPVHKRPTRVYVTSLFTWAWKPVWQAVRHYKKLFPGSKVWLGGLYASLLPEHAARSKADHLYKGLFREAECLMPDYGLVPEWDGSIIFSSRGCNNRCPYCAVPVLEGSLNSVRYSIRSLVYRHHTRIILWDNNILQSPNWDNVVDELQELGLKVDFNQGLDARLVTEKVARQLAALRLDSGRGIKVRMAYDVRASERFVRKAVERLNSAGIKGREIMFYTLFNHAGDGPEDFFERVREILELGAVSYPMRYEPLNALKKNTYVSPNWTAEEINVVQRARRVLGYGGAFPPYQGLVRKLNRAHGFHQAFKLRVNL